MSYTTIPALPEQLFGSVQGSSYLLLSTDTSSYKITVDTLQQSITGLFDSTAGSLTNKTIDSTTNTVIADGIHFPAIANSAVTLGTPLKIIYNTSTSDTYVDVATGTDTVNGIAQEDIAAGSLGKVLFFGKLQGINTVPWGMGTKLYYQNGNLLSTPDLSVHAQFIGYVSISSTSGEIIVCNLSTDTFANNVTYYNGIGRLTSNNVQNAIDEVSGWNIVTTSMIQIANNSITLPTTAVDGVIGNIAQIYQSTSSTYFTEYTCTMNGSGTGVNFDSADNLNNLYAVVTYKSRT